MKRLDSIFAAIDACNSADPNRLSGEPAEWLYGRRMSEMLNLFAPQADLAVQIAVRGQHIERWSLPRSDFPEGKAGYHRWRNEQKRRHADKLADLMIQCGFGAEEIARVGSIVRKEKLKQDADAQCLEDVACLVFLQYYAADFAAKHEKGKVLDILAKTWSKMSQAGKATALRLDMPAAVAALIREALPQELDAK